MNQSSTKTKTLFLVNQFDLVDGVEGCTACKQTDPGSNPRWLVFLVMNAGLVTSFSTANETGERLTSLPTLIQNFMHSHSSGDSVTPGIPPSTNHPPPSSWNSPRDDPVWMTGR